MLRSTMIFLVLLRLAIGWHFLFEGVHKLHDSYLAYTPDGKPAQHKPFSSAGYFREAPGPFAFASETRVRRVLSDAGFADIVLEPHDLELDIATGRGLDTAVRAAMTIGPTSRMLDGQSDAVREAATADIRNALAAHARGDRVPLGAAIWIVSAVNPGV